MSEINTGGRAFPWCGDLNETPHIGLGMTLRDYFAAHAPITYRDAFDILDQEMECVGPWPVMRVLDRLAELRMDYANAMIAAREAKS